MNGVLVLSTRSGACLFARAFREDFGLPGGWDTHGDGKSVSPTGRSFGAMQLAGLIFALDLNARELQGDRPDPDPDPGVAARVGVPTFAEGADARPGLVRWAVGDCALHFRKDNARQVMVVVFAAASFGDDTPGALADALLRGFVAKHAEHLEGFGGPSKTLKFERETHAAALDVPAAIAEKIRRAAGFESGWVYAALSRRLATEADADREWYEDAGPDDEDWDENGDGGLGDGDGDGDPSDARPRGRFDGPRSGKRVGVGARSGVAFAEDGEGNGAPSGDGGGGWFRFSRAAAARRVRLAGSADAGAVQFVHRVRTADQSSVSTTGVRFSGAHETLSDAALEGLAATIHAAAEAMARARPGRATRGACGRSSVLSRVPTRVPMQRVPTRMPMQKVSTRVPLRTTDLFACSRSCGTVSRWRSRRKPSGRGRPNRRRRCGVEWRNTRGLCAERCDSSNTSCRRRTSRFVARSDEQ